MLKKYNLSIISLGLAIVLLVIYWVNGGDKSQEVQGLLLSFGVGLFFTGIVDFLILRADQEKIIIRLKNEGYIRTKVKKSLEDFALKEVYENLSEKKLSNDISKAKDIKIIKTWFHEIDTIDKGLILAIENKAKICLHLLHPTSPLLIYRSLSVSDDASYGETQIRNGLTSIKDAIEKYHNTSTTISFYDQWPGAPLIKLDSKILVGFYLLGRSSPSWPWLEFDIKSTILGENLTDQFEKIKTVGKELKTAVEIETFLNDRSNWTSK
jgi:hypothetical protein